MLYQKSQQNNVAIRSNGRLLVWLSCRLGRLSLLLLVVMLIAGFFMLRTNRAANQQIAVIEQQKTEIVQEIAQEYEKQLEMKALQNYYGTDKYYMEMARIRFNLIREGDHIYLFD